MYFIFFASNRNMKEKEMKGTKDTVMVKQHCLMETHMKVPMKTESEMAKAHTGICCDGIL